MSIQSVPGLDTQPPNSTSNATNPNNNNGGNGGNGKGKSNSSAVKGVNWSIGWARSCLLVGLLAGGIMIL
jgi:hypothetical protein